MHKSIRGSVLAAMGTLLPFGFTSASAVAAEAPTVSGYVDTQFQYNWDMPKSQSIAYRSYDAKDNNFATTAGLQAAGNVAEGVGYVIKLQMGSDAMVTNASGENVILHEGFITYTAPCKFGFKVGKFVTYEGIEVVEPLANPNISKGYLFNLAEPVSHTGGVLTYAAGKFDFAVGAVNGWDLQKDNNKGKTLVGKVGMNFGDPLNLTLSGYSGPEQATQTAPAFDNRFGATRNSLDLTGVTKLLPKTDLWIQGNWGEEQDVLDTDANNVGDAYDKWAGFGIQPVFHFTEKFSVGARYENFWNRGGSRTNGVADAALNNISITPAYKLADAVTLRLEYRYDSSNKKVFEDDKGAAKDSTSSTLAEIGITF